MNKHCKCKIQNAPIYKKIKGIFYFVCQYCGKVRKIVKDSDYLTMPESADWDINLGDFTIDMMVKL